VQLIIPTDAAHETIAELGDLGLLQFKDLNPGRDAFERTYVSQVRSRPDRFEKLHNMLFMALFRSVVLTWCV
jgi:V-type H+-transporting ATPase subunit a